MISHLRGSGVWGNNKPVTIVTHECMFCGVEFVRPLDRWKEKRLKFCSTKCHADSRRNPSGTYKHGDGYIMQYAPDHPKADKNGYVLQHILIAEKALGKYLPEKVIVHHFDIDPENNANTNLVICEDQAYHLLLHVRQRVLAAGGDPNTDKICPGPCKSIKNRNMFHRNKYQPDGLATECKDCKGKRDREYAIRKRIKRESSVALIPSLL